MADSMTNMNMTAQGNDTSQHDPASHDAAMAGDCSANDQIFATTFTALNNSGVHGAAALVYDPDCHTLTVQVDGTGFEPGQTHMGHIHGFTDNTAAHTPGLPQDADHDGFVELAEGLKTYGPILLNLTSPPTNAAAVGDGTFGGKPNMNDFPHADANGEIHFQQTYTFDPNDPKSQSLLDTIKQFDHKEIVFHGETVAAGSGAGTAGEVDGTAGYKAALPVASGEIHGVNGDEANTIVADMSHDQQSGGHSLSDFLLGHV